MAVLGTVVIKTTKDGRTIRTGKDYTAFRREVYEMQSGRCVRCIRTTSLEADILSDYSFHVHHRDGRGMGGSKRDDVPSKVEGLCGKDHRLEHHQ
jgi:hypothetical protein